MAEDGSVVIGGLAGRTTETTLRRLVGGAAGRAPVVWRTATFNGPYCRVLDIIRPAARQFGSVGHDIQLGLRSGPSKLRTDDSIVPRFVMPDYAGYAQLSYVTHTGDVYHLYPSEPARQVDIATPDGRRQSLKVPGMDVRQFPAGATIHLGDPETSGFKPGEIGWQVGEPYGIDMMLIAVSSQRLFPQARPAMEKVDTYLRDLQAAVESATRRGSRVNTRAVLVETEAR